MKYWRFVSIKQDVTDLWRKGALRSPEQLLPQLQTWNPTLSVVSPRIAPCDCWYTNEDCARSPNGFLSLKMRYHDYVLDEGLRKHWGDWMCPSIFQIFGSPESRAWTREFYRTQSSFWYFIFHARIVDTLLASPGPPSRSHRLVGVPRIQGGG